MKKLFLICATAALLASCNSDSKSGMETNKEIVPDTSQYRNAVNTDTAKTAPVPLAVPLPRETVKSKEAKKTVETKKNATDKVSTGVPVTPTESPVSTTPVTSTTTVDSTTNTSTVAPKKKGMSKSAKDAIIGGGAGAIGGAIVSKKKGKGAIIGGLLGAGAGYILGRKKDKKDTAR